MTQTSRVIDQVAPNLAKALNSPFSEIAKSFILENLNDEDTPEGIKGDDIFEAILSNHNNLNALKEIDINFKKKLESLGVDIDSLEKRERKINYQLRKTPQFSLSILFIFLYFAILAAILFIECSDVLNMSKGENSLLGELEILIGVLTGGVAQVLSYWFGGPISSTGNSDKE